MCPYMSIIKNNKQHVGRKRGNFGKSQNFLEPPSKKKRKKKKCTWVLNTKKKSTWERNNKKKTAKKIEEKV